MEKNIKDYMKFYIGCEVAELPKGKHDGMCIDRVTSVTEDGDVFVSNGYMLKADSIKPILRKLESMTEGEWQEIRFDLSADIVASVPLVKWSDKPRWVIVLENRVQTNTLKLLDGIELIKREYDVFNLIESGLAIEKQPTTQNQGV